MTLPRDAAAPGRRMAMEWLPWPATRGAIQREWLDLEARHGAPRHYQRHAWFEMLAAESAGAEVGAAVIRLEGRAVAVAGLGRLHQRRAWLRAVRLRLLHDAPMFSDWIATPEVGPELASEAIRLLIAPRGGLGDLLELRRTPAESALIGALDPRVRLHPRSLESAPPHRVYVLDGTVPMASFLEGLSRSHRRNLRSARRRLEAAGGAVVAVHTPRDEDDPRLAEFLELEASGWKGRTRNFGILTSPEKLAAHRRRMAVLTRLGLVRLHFLESGNRLLAAQLCITDPSRWYLYKIAYDESAARFAPGNLLLEWLLEELRRAGVPALDLYADHPGYEPWGAGATWAGFRTVYAATGTGRLAWWRARWRHR